MLVVIFLRSQNAENFRAVADGEIEGDGEAETGRSRR